MKIGPTPNDGLRADGAKPVGTERASPVRTGSGSEPVSSPVGVDRVSLSGGGASVLGESATVPPFDDKKVEQVRQMIAEGRFPVDARRVAESLLADSRDILGLKPTTP